MRVPTWEYYIETTFCCTVAARLVKLMGPTCVTEIDGHGSGPVSLATIFIQLDATGELTYKPEQQF